MEQALEAIEPLTSTQSNADSKRGLGEVAPTPQASDPQVRAPRKHKPRRSFTTAYKLRMLAAYDDCSHALERGELLRREGLYHSRIAAWRSQQTAGRLSGSVQRGLSSARVDHLNRENEQLKKKLAQAQAVIELQKKVSDLLGMHILPHEPCERS